MTDQHAQLMLRELSLILKEAYPADSEMYELAQALEAGAAALGAFVSIEKQLDEVGHV